MKPHISIVLTAMLLSATSHAAPDWREGAAKVLAKFGVPGAAVAIVTPDETLARGGVGFADFVAKTAVTENTRFLVGSISKTFLALAALTLVQDGKLRLEDEVRKLAPEIALENPWEKTAPLTVAHLLEHSHGAAVEAAPWFLAPGQKRPPLAELVTHADFRHSIIRPPGTLYQYDNYGYMIAAYLVEKTAGVPYEQFLMERVLRPLGMTDTGFDGAPLTSQDARGYYAGTFAPVERPILTVPAIGGMYSSARDMARLVQFYLSDGVVSGKQVLARELVRRAEETRTTRHARQGVPYGYGLGIWSAVWPRGRLHTHGGLVDGFCSVFAYDRERGVGYVFLSNVLGDKAGYAAAADLMQQMHDDLGLGTPMPEPETELPTAVARLAGDYVNPAPIVPVMRLVDTLLGARTISVRDGKIFASTPLGAERRLVPVGGRALRYEDQPVPSVFVLDEGTDDEAVFVDNDAQYVRAPTAGPLRIVFAACVLMMLTSTVTFLVLTRRLVRRELRRADLAATLALGSCVAALAQLLAAARMAGVGTTAYLTSANVATVVFCVAPVVQAALGVAALVASVQLARCAQRSRLGRIHHLSVAVACCILALILWKYGLIGAKLWA